MRKLIITCSIVLSGFACAQSSDNPYIYEDEPSAEEQDVFPSNPGDPNPAAFGSIYSFSIINGNWNGCSFCKK